MKEERGLRHIMRGEASVLKSQLRLLNTQCPLIKDATLNTRSDGAKTSKEQVFKRQDENHTAKVHHGDEL